MTRWTISVATTIVPTAAAASRELRHRRVMTFTTRISWRPSYCGLRQLGVTLVTVKSSAPAARSLRTVQASSSKRRVASARGRNLAHEHKRQSGAKRNQERPDEEFQPINRGHIARPQIVPARHGDGPPCPWQLRHNVEPRPGVPSLEGKILGCPCRSGPIRGKVRLSRRLERIHHRRQQVAAPGLLPVTLTAPVRLAGQKLPIPLFVLEPPVHYLHHYNGPVIERVLPL